MRASRRAGLIAAGIGTVVLGMASLAWACSPNASLTVNPSTVVQGGTVEVVGATFFADRPVSIHVQNQAGQDVVPPQSSMGPNPTARFTVPAALAPGAYNVYATVVDESGKTWAHARAFQVTASSQPSGGAGGDATQGGAGSGTTSGRTGGSVASPGTDQAQPEAASPDAASPSDAASPVAVDAASPVAVDAPSSTPTPASSSAPVAQRPRAAAAGGGTAPARPAAGGTAAAPAPGTSPVPAVTEAPAEAAAVPALSPRTATAEFWNGFAQSSSASGPSLEDAAASARRSPGFGVGIGLLGASLPLLVGALGFALLRRRALAGRGPTQGG